MSPGSTGTPSAATDFNYQPSPDQSAATPVRHPVVIIGAGTGRSRRRARSRTKRPQGGRAGRRQHGLHRIAGDLLVQTGAGDHGPAGCRRRTGGKGRDLAEGQGLLRRGRALCLRPAAGGGPPHARLHQSAAVPLRSLHRPRGDEEPGDRPSLEQQTGRCREQRRWRRP